MLKYDIGILIVFISLLFKKNTISFYVMLFLFVIASLFNIIKGFEISNLSMLMIAIASLSFIGDYKSTWRKSRFIFILLVMSILTDENNFLTLFLIYLYSLILKNLSLKKYDIRSDFIAIALLSVSLIFYSLATNGLRYDPFLVVNEFYANFFIVGVTLFTLVSTGIFLFNVDDLTKRKPLHEESFITAFPVAISIFIFAKSIIVVQSEIDFKLLNILRVIVVIFVLLDNFIRVFNCITYSSKNKFQLIKSGISFVIASAVVLGEINIVSLYAFFILTLLTSISKNLKSKILKYLIGLLSFFIYIFATTSIVVSMYGKINDIMFYTITATYVVVSYVYLKIISVEYGPKIRSKIQKSDNHTGIIQS
jgi:hypothetical protein